MQLNAFSPYVRLQSKAQPALSLSKPTVHFGNATKRVPSLLPFEDSQEDLLDRIRRDDDVGAANAPRAIVLAPNNPQQEAVLAGMLQAALAQAIQDEALDEDNSDQGPDTETNAQPTPPPSRREIPDVIIGDNPFVLYDIPEEEEVDWGEEEWNDGSAGQSSEESQLSRTSSTNLFDEEEPPAGWRQWLPSCNIL